jgi:hypothetical protein
MGVILSPEGRAKRHLLRQHNDPKSEARPFLEFTDTLDDSAVRVSQQWAILPSKRNQPIRVKIAPDVSRDAAVRMLHRILGALTAMSPEEYERLSFEAAENDRYENG